MEEAQHEPKISLPEEILIGIFIGVLDIADIIPGVGDITSVVASPLILYLYMKGVNGLYFIVAEVLDLFPVIQEFPVRSIAWWATVILDHYGPKKLTAELEKAGELAEGKEGSAATGAAGEATGAAATGVGAEATATRKEIGAVGAEAGVASERVAVRTGTGEVEEAGGARLTRREGMSPGESEMGGPESEVEKKEISPEALGGQKEPIEKLKEELTEETPQSPYKTQDQNENNVIDLAQRRKQRQEQGRGRGVQLNDNEIDLAA